MPLACVLRNSPMHTTITLAVHLTNQSTNMSRPLVQVVCNREINTDAGVLKYGDVIAVMRSELDPLTVASMLAYGQATIQAIDTSEVPGEFQLAGRKIGQPGDSDLASATVNGRAGEILPVGDHQQSEQPASQPLVTKTDLATDQMSEKSSDASVQEKHYATSEIDKLAPEVDAGAIMAVKDLGITKFTELRERLATGERLKGIGDQRRKQLNEVLEKRDGSTGSSSGIA